MPPKEPTQIPLTIITYRDAILWSMKYKKGDYKEQSSIIRLSEEDLKALGISSGKKVVLENEAGKVVVKADVEKKCPKGFGFMPVSPVANQLAGYSTGNLPDFKSIKVVASAYVSKD